MPKRAGFFVFGGWPLAFGRFQPRFSLRFLPHLFAALPTASFRALSTASFCCASCRIFSLRLLSHLSLCFLSGFFAVLPTASFRCASCRSFRCASYCIFSLRFLPHLFAVLPTAFFARFLLHLFAALLVAFFAARSAVFYHGFPGVGGNPILSVRTRIRSGRLQEPFIRTLGRWSCSRKARNRSLASGVFGRKIDPLPSFVRSRAAARSSAFRSGSPVFAARSCGRTGGGTSRSTARTAPRQWPVPGCSDGLLRCGGRSGGAQRGETDGG